MTDFRFAGLPWGTSERAVELELFRLGFVERYRYDGDTPVDPRNIVFVGTLDDERIQAGCEFTRAHERDTSQFGLRSVAVEVIDSSKSFEEIWRWFLDLLSAKYGPPLSTSDRMSDGVHVLGAFWGDDRLGDDSITLIFNEDGFVIASYDARPIENELRAIL